MCVCVCVCVCVYKTVVAAIVTETSVVHGGFSGPQRLQWSTETSVVHRDCSGPRRLQWSTETPKEERSR